MQEPQTGLLARPNVATEQYKAVAGQEPAGVGFGHVLPFGGGEVRGELRQGHAEPDGVGNRSGPSSSPPAGLSSGRRSMRSSSRASSESYAGGAGVTPTASWR